MEKCPKTNMHSFYANTLLNNDTIYLTLTPEVLATVYLNISISFKNSAQLQIYIVISSFVIINYEIIVNLIVWLFTLKLVLQACYEYHLTWAWVPHVVREMSGNFRVSGEWSPCYLPYVVLQAVWELLLLSHNVDWELRSQAEAGCRWGISSSQSSHHLQGKETTPTWVV